LSSLEGKFLETSDEIKKFKGKWIAILDTKIIAYGKNLSEVYEKTLKKNPHRTPLYHRVPLEGEVDTFIL